MGLASGCGVLASVGGGLGFSGVLVCVVGLCGGLGGLGGDTGFLGLCSLILGDLCGLGSCGLVVLGRFLGAWRLCAAGGLVSAGCLGVEVSFVAEVWSWGGMPGMLVCCPWASSWVGFWLLWSCLRAIRSLANQSC